MQNKKGIFYYLFVLNLIVLVLPVLSSCGKNEATPSSSDVQFQVLNLSPDAYPIELNINNLKTNSFYRYNATPTYFYLTTTAYPIQIRTTRTDDSIRILTRDTIQFLPNTRYSLFFTGLRSEGTRRSIVTVDDTASLPPIGKGGRIRFVNTAARNTGAHDIWANGVRIIQNTPFAGVSGYATLPPGNYNFRIYPVNTSASSLAELNNITIQDGRLYTLYSRGIVGRAVTDTAAFGIAVLANNPPKR